jgi:hypothetical protein
MNGNYIDVDRLINDVAELRAQLAIAATEIKRQRENERRWHVQIAENAGLRGDNVRLRAALEALVRDVSDADARQPFVDAVATLAALAPTQELPRSFTTQSPVATSASSPAPGSPAPEPC